KWSPRTASLGAMAAAARCEASRNDGFVSSGHQAQKLRNHKVGNTWISASASPRLAMLISINMSVGEAFAYSTNTSKYRSSLNMPVSSSSYSESVLLQRMLVCIRFRYGYSFFGYL